MQTTTPQSDNPLFEAKTRDTVALKRLTRALAATVTETSVTISDDGIRFRAADVSMVAMIDLHLAPALFTQFDAPAEPVEFHVSADALKDRVTEARNGDEVTLAYRHDGRGEHVLGVEIWSNGVTSTFGIDTSTVDDMDKPGTDDLDFSGEAVVALDTFKDAIDRMGDAATLTLYDDRLVVTGDTAQVEIVDNSDYLFGVALDDGPVTATYATAYLETVCKLKNTVNHVELRFGTDFPLQAAVDRDAFTMTYTVAPRIEE